MHYNEILSTKENRMKTIKKAYGASKGFVSNHKSGLLVLGGATLATAGIIGMSVLSKGSSELFDDFAPTDAIQ